MKDEVDYLIDTYGGKSGFFDNMDAVQAGFISICLYSGSYIRGELYKNDSFWSLSNSPHKDQSFYIQSPYSRKGSKSLFASAVYPFRYDSVGVPSMMGRIAERLDSSASYVWDSNSHAHINVTYKGETHRYGGQGYGEGQGLSEDKITRYFTFDKNDAPITLDSIKQLLGNYSKVEMQDDVPRENALTWESICDTVGDGAWVRLTKIGSIFGGTSSGYAYLYKESDGKDHWTDAAGNNGAELYWGGDLGYASDTWVDGRYVDSWETYAAGEKFEDHPTSDILLRDVTIPQISYDRDYKYNQSTGNNEIVYTNIEIAEKQKDVLFTYAEQEKHWIADSHAFDSGCATYQDLVNLVKGGWIDEKYLSMVTLTPEEVKALQVDKNTDVVPKDYFIYDGTTEPGTSIKNHKHNYTSEITKQPTCTEEGVKTSTCRVCGDTQKESVPAAGHKEVTDKAEAPTLTKTGKTAGSHCKVCGTVLKAQKSVAKLIPVSKVKVTGLSSKYYTGKKISPSLKVYYNNKLLKSGTDYTVSYGTNKAVGKGKVTISGKGKYGGKITKTFSILPRTTSVSVKSTKRGKLNFTVTKRSEATKYQIQYATNSKFKSAKTLTTTSLKPVVSASSKKTYCVRVRTVKTVGKTNYYSGWSSVKKVKVK